MNMTTQRESIKSWVESHGGNDAIAKFKCGDRSANWLIEKALQALSQPNEPIYIVGKGWQCDIMPKSGTPLFLSPPTAQPNEPVGKIDATDDGDYGTQYWGELDMVILEERGFKVGDNLFISPPNLEAKIAELEARNKELQSAGETLMRANQERTTEIAELTAKSERLSNLYSNSNGRVQELIKELNITDSAMNVLSSNEKAKFRAEYKKLLEECK